MASIPSLSPQQIRRAERGRPLDRKIHGGLLMKKPATLAAKEQIELLALLDRTVPKGPPGREGLHELLSAMIRKIESVPVASSAESEVATSNLDELLATVPHPDAVYVTTPK